MLGGPTVRDTDGTQTSADFGIEKDAFGCDEYHPLSHQGSNLTGIGSAGIGYMIVDAIDTMMLMQETGDKEIGDMYDRSRAWVTTHLSFSHAGLVNTFEVTRQSELDRPDLTMGGL